MSTVQRATTTGVAHARVALAGNPSDGHGGAVLALTLPELTATVRALPGPPRPDEPPLLLAARARFAEGTLGPDDDELPSPALQLGTSIPREVGLAGSSAIVVAAMRALADWHGVDLDPLTLARLALEAETVELGLAAGPQDRLAQATEGLVHMDFSGGRWVATRLDRDLLPPLFVAWLTSSAEPSGRWHAALARRTDVQEVMDGLAAQAARARDALLAGDHAAFGAALDATFDARASLGPLEPAHVRLVETARAAGASVNYAGSGGAIVGTVPADGPGPVLGALRRLGCGVLVV